MSSVSDPTDVGPKAVVVENGVERLIPLLEYLDMKIAAQEEANN